MSRSDGLPSLVSIPEMLGFQRIDFDRKRAFSRVSYQAQYLLYEDEADALLREFAPDAQSAAMAHPHIDLALHQRYGSDSEYRARVNGGYREMERKMQKADVIPENEEEIKRQMRRMMRDA